MFKPMYLIQYVVLLLTVKEDTLTDMVLHMTEKVGLVHQMPFMLDGNLPFSRVLEKVSHAFSGVTTIV